MQNVDHKKKIQKCPRGITCLEKFFSPGILSKEMVDEDMNYVCVYLFKDFSYNKTDSLCGIFKFLH